MLSFKKIETKDYDFLNPYIQKTRVRLSDYSFGCKIMWQKKYRTEYAVLGDFLIFKENHNSIHYFNFPISLSDSSDINNALNAIEEYCLEKEYPLVFCDIPQENIHFLEERYDNFEIHSYRYRSDYIYNINDFQLFSGKKYAGQRNHIHKFLSLYPNYRFRVFTENDKKQIDAFFDMFLQESERSDEMKNECVLAKRLINECGFRHFVTAGVELDGKIISLSCGEVMGDTLIVHIEKALSCFEGLYTITAHLFSKLFDNVQYINREDDAGVEGLRISKMQYHPCALAQKYSLFVKNELYEINSVPTITTNRLVLDEISLSDCTAYNRLCSDEERNRYWGYDYKEDLVGELYAEYFFDTQKKDFEKKNSINFAIRLNNVFIGEGIFYHFDGKGTAELGLRISADKSSNGYGKEAFDALLRWGLYDLGLKKVVAKCYKENIPSKKMLTSLMHVGSDDEKYYYFYREN